MDELSINWPEIIATITITSLLGGIGWLIKKTVGRKKGDFVKKIEEASQQGKMLANDELIVLHEHIDLIFFSGWLRTGVQVGFLSFLAGSVLYYEKIFIGYFFMIGGVLAMALILYQLTLDVLPKNERINSARLLGAQKRLLQEKRSERTRIQRLAGKIKNSIQEAKNSGSDIKELENHLEILRRSIYKYDSIISEIQSDYDDPTNDFDAAARELESIVDNLQNILGRVDIQTSQIMADAR